MFLVLLLSVIVELAMAIPYPLSKAGKLKSVIMVPFSGNSWGIIPVFSLVTSPFSFLKIS